VGEISGSTVEALPTTEPPEYIDGRPLLGNCDTLQLKAARRRASPHPL